jgi:hypothetical protein
MRITTEKVQVKRNLGHGKVNLQEIFNTIIRSLERLERICGVERTKQVGRNAHADRLEQWIRKNHVDVRANDVIRKRLK